MIRQEVSNEVGGIILAAGIAGIVVIEQTVAFFDSLQSEQDNGGYAFGQLADSSHIGLAVGLGVVDPIDKPSHIGLLLRSDDEGLV